jgi:hypothetical protein
VLKVQTRAYFPCRNGLISCDRLGFVTVTFLAERPSHVSGCRHFQAALHSFGVGRCRWLLGRPCSDAFAVGRVVPGLIAGLGRSLHVTLWLAI